MSRSLVGALGIPLSLVGLFLAAALVGAVGPAAGDAGRPPPATSVARRSVDWRPEPGHAPAVPLDRASLASELSAELSGRWLGTTAFGTASVDEVAVVLRDDRLIVRGTALAGWTLLPLDLSGRADASAGTVLVRIEEAYLGDTVLPGPARREVEQALQEGIDRRLSRPDLALTSRGQSGSGAGSR